jgi:hypothetical protein
MLFPFFSTIVTASESHNPSNRSGERVWTTTGMAGIRSWIFSRVSDRSAKSGSRMTRWSGC